MSNLGGGVQGFSEKQTINNYKDGQQTSTRDRNQICLKT